MRELFNLAGRKALITGGSVSMGRAITLALAEHGAEVAIHYSAEADQAFGLPDAAEKTAAEARCLGVRAHTIEGDLAKSGAGRRVHERAVDLLGQVDILVLCAAIQYNVPFLEVTEEEFTRQVDINFRSAFEMMQLTLPPMAQRGWGRVVTIGSVNQVKPSATTPVYAALKSANMNLVLNLAKQYASQGVTLNNIAPGLIETERNKWRRNDMAEWKALEVGISPAGRAGQPVEVAGAALLFCSDAGAYITGADLMITGGGHLGT